MGLRGRARAGAATAVTLGVLLAAVGVAVAGGRAGPAPATSPAAARVLPVVVTAVGDLCKEPGVGDTTGATSCRHTAQQVMAVDPDYHVMLGDMQYDKGTIAQINAAYAPSWGPLKARTLPVIGNHEQRDPAALPGYCRYFDPGRTGFCLKGGSYAYLRDVGNNWVVLSVESTGVLTAAQKARFDSLLQSANSRAKNVLLAFHEPRFSTSCLRSPTGGARCHGTDPQVDYYWDQAVDKKVDLVINGHDHKYERFFPLTRSDTPQRDDANGLVEIIDGMGANTNDPGCDRTRNRAVSAFCAGDARGLTGQVDVDDTVRNGGVLILKLLPTSFSWEFREAENSLTDASVGIGRLVDRGSRPTR